MKRDFKFYWEEPYGKVKEKSSDEINFNIPGFKKGEIKISIADNSLTVSASKKSRKVEKGEGFYREETSASSFSKSMSLPHETDPHDFDVIIKDGAVTLRRKKRVKKIQ